MVVTVVVVMFSMTLGGAPAAAANGHPLVKGASNEDLYLNGGDPGPWLKAHHATVMRLTVPAPPDMRNGLAAVQAAYAEHYNVSIDIAFPRGATVPRIVTYFKARVRLYANYASSISVGNEEDLWLSAAKYRQVWNAVAPFVHKLAPKVTLVFGEVTPWGFNWLKSAWGRTAPTRAGAVSLHGYHTTRANAGLMALPLVARWAQAKHVPLWDTESGPATKYRVFLVREPASRFYSTLAAIERRSPNLKLVVQYYWPAIGSY